MNPARIEGANVCFKRPAGSRADQCVDLFVRREVIAVGDPPEEWIGLSSAWTPTAEELAALNAGAAIILTIMGTQQPPVSLHVSDPPTLVASIAVDDVALSDETIRALAGQS